MSAQPLEDFQFADDRQFVPFQGFCCRLGDSPPAVPKSVTQVAFPGGKVDLTADDDSAVEADNQMPDGMTEVEKTEAERVGYVFRPQARRTTIFFEIMVHHLAIRMGVLNYASHVGEGVRVFEGAKGPLQVE